MTTAADHSLTLNENNLATGSRVPDDPDEPDLLERRSRLYRALVVTERVAACGLLVAMLGLVVLQVVSRYVFSTPFGWTEELARFVLVWLTFVSAGFVMARRIHITVDLVASRLGRRGVLVMDGLALSTVAAVAATMAWAGLEFARGAARLAAPATSLPMSTVYGAAVVGFALILVHALLHIYLDIRHPEFVPDATDRLERKAA